MVSAANRDATRRVANEPEADSNAAAIASQTPSPAIMLAWAE